MYHLTATSRSPCLWKSEQPAYRRRVRPAIGRIEANTNQLRCVFINVINNACDAMRE
jgi:C4-dicarboxylate-specific signal transduction histidine kinase